MWGFIHVPMICLITGLGQWLAACWVQTVTWTTANLLSIWSWIANFGEIWMALRNKKTFTKSDAKMAFTIHYHGPFTRYVKLRVAHAPGMPGTFSPPPRVSDPDMHHGECAMHMPGWVPESLASGCLWSRWQGKRSRHSRCMRNPLFNVSGKRPLMLIGGNWASGDRRHRDCDIIIMHTEGHIIASENLQFSRGFYTLTLRNSDSEGNFNTMWDELPGLLAHNGY